MATERWFYKYDGQRIEVTLNPETGFVGKFHITAVEGKPFKTASDLRHHRGQTIETATLLYIDIDDLEFESNQIGVEIGPHGELRVCNPENEFWRINIGFNSIEIWMHNTETDEYQSTSIARTIEFENAVVLAHDLRWANYDATSMRHITNTVDVYLF